MAVKTTILVPNITLNLPFVRIELKLRERKMKIAIRSILC